MTRCPAENTRRSKLMNRESLGGGRLPVLFPKIRDAWEIDMKFPEQLLAEFSIGDCGGAQSPFFRGTTNPVIPMTDLPLLRTR